MRQVWWVYGTFWDEFRDRKIHFSMVKKNEKFSNFLRFQKFLGFYRLAWLRLLKLTLSSKHPKSILWVSKSISRLQLTLWSNFGEYRKHYKINCDARKCIFNGQKEWKIFKFFEIPKISLQFTDLYGFNFWSLRWLLSVQKEYCGYLKLSPGFG